MEEQTIEKIYKENSINFLIKRNNNFFGYNKLKLQSVLVSAIVFLTGHGLVVERVDNLNCLS